MSEAALEHGHSQDESVTSKSKMDAHRPAHISISKVVSDNRKWKECKVVGKNISVRSYGAACAFRSRFYVYGGYQILHGALADFYSIDLDEAQTLFQWEEIVTTGPSPGPRSKHALVSTADSIFLVGGLVGNTVVSNDIFRFDPAPRLWTKVHPKGTPLPALESFGCTTTPHPAHPSIILACGFDEARGGLSNAVYQYDIMTNEVRVVLKAGESGLTPRLGCAVAANSEKAFLFGGKNEDYRFNDLWVVDLASSSASEVKCGGEIPIVRSGHSLTFFEGRLYLFGGIHDVTWELDDLHIFDVARGKWEILEQDSPRKVGKKLEKEQAVDASNERKSSSKKKSWYDTVGSGVRAFSPKKMSATSHEESVTKADSPGKMLDEQRRKVFYQRKADMLKNFEVGKEDRAKLLSLETSSQAMRYSLDVIGELEGPGQPSDGRLTNFGKESVSKFLGPLENHSSIVIGKRPCARDGHCAVVLQEDLVIFGGDRHQMSFNDLYKLDLSLAHRSHSDAR